MRMQEIKVTLKDGKIKIKCEGFQGTECDEIAEIENTIGTIISKEDTPEAFLEVQELPDILKQGF